jgi:hypothetical protein
MQKKERSFAEAMISADASVISSLTPEDLTLLLSSWTLSEQIPSFFCRRRGRLRCGGHLWLGQLLRQGRPSSPLHKIAAR